MKLNRIFFLLNLLFLPAALFAEWTVVNPAPGTYANAQTLVIETRAGEEIFYSFSGSDPLISGLAYDGPVLLDVQGNVELRIVSVDIAQNRSERVINYSVEPSYSENEAHNEFLKSLETGPVFDYSAGNRMAVPFTMEYSFAENNVFEKGKEISLSKESTVERFLPVNFREGADGTKVWRYVLHLLPGRTGELTRRDVPFAIRDWTKIAFTDPKLLYSLDGDWWQGAAQGATVDRSEENTLYYQSASYTAENPVTRVTIPEKPALNIERLFDGSIKISAAPQKPALQGSAAYDSPASADSEASLFRLSSSVYSNRKIIGDGLYPYLILDTFSGDKIEETIPLDVYYDGIYQGTLFAEIDLNRTTPNIPLVQSSALSSYWRDDVTVTASARRNLKIFASVSNPVEIKPSFSLPELSSIKFERGEYNRYYGVPITFFADTEKILAYKVSFYTEDSDGTKSETVDYSVVIDKYNYYVDSSSSVPDSDGSPSKPFKDLRPLSRIVNSSSFSHFFIRGQVELPSGEQSLASNVEFTGLDDARIILPANSAFVLKNSGFFAENVIFEKSVSTRRDLSKKPRAAAASLTNLFVMDHSAATLRNCTIIAGFTGDGTVFNVTGGALSLEGCGITGNAQGFSSAITAVGSKISVKKSRVLSIGTTAVNFSSNGGTFMLDNNVVQVTARNGRSAEFIDSAVSLSDNKFSAEVSVRAPAYKMIYTAGSTSFVKNEGNIFK